jgi:acetoacetate decarboxylase
MSGFVRTPEEVERIRERLAENRFYDARRLSIRYLTRPSIVDRVLPPGLEPADEPLVQVDVVEVGRSNCVGSFAGGGLYVKARHDDRVGNYCLAMPMSTEAAITWGRELFGEPKKRATVALERNDDTISGRISRYGNPIVEIDATLDAERDVDPAARTVFHYKYLPDATGRGFQFDPTLVAVTFESDLHRYETGTGSVSLATTEHDPLGEIVCEEVLETSYSVADIASSQENLVTVDPDAFLPYAFGAGRVDDWLALDNLSEPDHARRTG